MAVGLGCGTWGIYPTLSGYSVQGAGEGNMSTGGERGLLAPLLGCSESGRGMNYREKGQPAPFPGGMCAWEDEVLLSWLNFGSPSVPWGRAEGAMGAHCRWGCVLWGSLLWHKGKY